MEYPFELIVPLLVLKLGLNPDLLILRPSPLPRLILFWYLNPILFILKKGKAPQYPLSLYQSRIGHQFLHLAHWS
jgi:hypothetical protein